MKITPDTVKKSSLDSSRAMWYGIAFVALYCGLIYVVRPFMPQIDFAEDTGFAHYYWKLPNPTAFTRATAWGGYLLHQATIWYFIYYAQNNKLKYTKGLHRINIWALAANAFFILLHLVQTAIWYDGLAQDTHILSSQGAVIVMLVAILLMENQRRGLFFGKKIKALNKPAGVMRYYHGYLFSWAVIYTFWYHPMESTSGHLIGTFYTLLIMLQGSLFFTRIHVNRWWMFAQEGLVLIHGTLVAFMNAARDPGSPNMWKMFFFGFAALIVVTQMYGLGLKRWQRWLIIAAFILGTMVAYGGDWSVLFVSAAIFLAGQVDKLKLGVWQSRGVIGAIIAVALAMIYVNGSQWVAFMETIRIPVIEYLSVFVLAGLIGLGAWIASFFRQREVGAVSAD